jgi:hypothetical protein
MPLLAVATLALVTPAATAPSGAKPPNLIFALIDDFGEWRVD